MEQKARENRKILLYLLLILAFWAFCFVTLKLWLLPYAAAYQATGEMSVGYLAYAAIGLLFSTPAPFLSVLILALAYDRVSLRTFFRSLIRTGNKPKTILLTALFCALALVFALVKGTPNGEPWYLMPLGFLVMIPFVGFAEEAGWRGFLQPALERRLRYPFSVLAVAAIWFVWHLDLWLDPTSRHYGDSMAGFGITILVWAFALAALYRATHSVPACAVYHAFVDALGAVYDWNLLFDGFPGDAATNLYRLLLLCLSVILWLTAHRAEKKRSGFAKKSVPQGKPE